MDEDVEVPLILGRPFLATARAVIDVDDGKLPLEILSVPRYYILVRYQASDLSFSVAYRDYISGFNWFAGFWWRLLILSRLFHGFQVRRLLCSARPVAIQTSANPSASDQDLQQAQLWQLAQRTTALPLGRGAFTLATIYTLLTEAFTVPKLVLAGRLPAQQNATVNLDPSIRNIQELKSWPEFHNAVAAGLRLAPLQSFHCGHGKAYLFDKVLLKRVDVPELKFTLYFMSYE
ncbi:uncharacterized protein [Gossypium hirsutum]|uniref:Uncharacterized protein n=1 Tax=Gossypium hirsutum TaxID=3635 RepID=A0A1U8IHJ8_GOSHI|nr:uncharacterized protein LOC107895111 [Gossypium hirsutum]